MGENQRGCLVLIGLRAFSERFERALQFGLGALFLSLAQTSFANLASDLFEEGRYRACRTECMRELINAPNSENARMLKSLCEVLLGMAPTAELTALADSEEASMGVRTKASCELGRVIWKQGKEVAAIKRLAWSFYHAECRDIFLRAASGLHDILSENPELAADFSGLKTQVAACAGLRQSSNRKEYKSRQRQGLSPGLLASKPCEWIIFLYRSQISPALGRRCSLYPSCSEYAIQALARHGILGLTVYADRAVREPDVVARKEDPVVKDGVVKYCDSLDEHDQWMRNE